MTDKEATVYCIDLGKSMGKTKNGRDKSDLDWAMTYVWDKVTSIMAMGRKTTYQAIVAFKTDETNNELADDGFDNISVLQELAALSLNDLQRLRHLIQPSHTDGGDAISAVVVAIQMIAKHCKKLKYKRRVILVTNGSSPIDADDMDEIVSKLQEDNIELVILGVDFDDEEYGFKEEGKSKTKAANEATLKKMVADCDGTFGTLVEAIDELGMPRLKATRPIPSYKDELMLGDFEAFDTAMRIGVERYPRTMVARAPTASAFVQRDGADTAQASTTIRGDEDGDVVMTEETSLEAVRSTRKYEIQDDNAIGGKRAVDMSELAKGYEYGRTAVHIAESDQNVTKMETKMGLEIIGFIPMDNYDQFMGLSRTNVIIGRKGDTKASMALSSIIHALREVESYAIARLVSKADKPPILVLLAPLVEPDYECLVDIELPFAEDVRSYKFPPLDKVITVNGKSLKEHRNLPNDKLMNAMEAYVDNMDLSTFGKDEQGDDTDYLTFQDAFSPVLHRIDQNIRFRAVHPEAPLPAPYEILTRYSKPPQELADAAKSHLSRLVAAADVKRVPSKSQPRKKGTIVKPISGLDIAAILNGTGGSAGNKKRVDKNNPIPTFKQMLEDYEGDEGTDPTTIIYDAASQLGAVIKEQIKDSFGDGNYARVLEEMSVMRRELEEMEEPKAWNDWVKSLKTDVLREKLGGDRAELWWQVRKSDLGLLGGRGGVQSEEEQKEFLRAQELAMR
jgi:ATP-dependent DNA helicase 2 subunit 2